MGKFDLQRVKPPSILVWHHSVSPEGDDVRAWTDAQWKGWFNNIGKGRTYAGYAHSEHYELGTGTETFSAVPIVLVPNGDGKDVFTDTWRIVSVFDWYENIGWHCGNWDINTKSVGCETYGRWDNKDLPDNAVKVLAKWTRDNIDKKNGGITKLMAHNEIIATACPGKIKSKLSLLLDMINNPLNYDNLLQKKSISKEMEQELQKQITELDSKVSALTLESSGKQKLIEELTLERDQVKTELADYRKTSSDDFFTYKTQQDSKYDALQALYASQMNKYKDFESNDVVEDNEFLKQSEVLKTENKGLQDTLTLRDSKIDDLGKQLTAVSASTPEIPAIPVVQDEGLTIENKYDKSGYIKRFSLWCQTNWENVKVFFNHHPKLSGLGTIAGTIVWFAGQFLEQSLQVRIPTEINQATLVGLIITFTLIVYRINSAWKKKQQSVVILDTTPTQTN